MSESNSNGNNYREYSGLNLPEVEKEGGAVKLVQNWLNEASKSKEWKEYIRSKMQLSLF